jgi:hypothetical protein
MPSIKQLVTQTGADTFTSAELLLPSLDGKSGYSIKGIRANWVDFAAVAAADYSLLATVQTESTVLTFVDDELIDMVGWGLQNTAGTAVAIAVEPIKEHFLDVERITVQPAIYVAISSSGTSQANDVAFEVFYEVVKLTELEYLRMLAGGA